MKALLINGSPHANGCTFTALSIVAEANHAHLGPQHGLPHPRHRRRARTQRTTRKGSVEIHQFHPLNSSIWDKKCVSLSAKIELETEVF